ncbi:MAG: VOC family protein [Azospirillaceae bacterium]
MTGLSEFDHAILLVDDLDAAERGVAALGFRPTPRGVHGAGLGTANATVMMPDGRTYFEVLGVVDPNPRNADKQAKLARRGRHLYGLALKGDARAAAELFGTAGIREGDAFDFARDVDLPAGRAEARFTIAQTRADSLPGVWLFVCQQHTPDVVWRPDYLEHANGARSVTALIGSTGDRAALAEAWASLLGDRLHRADDAFRFDLGGTAIVFADPAALVDRLGVADPGAAPGLSVLAVQVASLAAAGDVLAQSGVPHHATPAGDLVVETRTDLGADFLFTERADAWA